MDAITSVLKDWDKEVLQDSSLVYDSKKLVNQLNNVIPVFGEYGLKYNTDALDSSSDWSLLNDNSIYVFKDLGKNAPALGNNKKGILIVVGEKGNEAQFVFTPHQMMYKTEGAWQKLLNTDDLQNIVNNYVKTSDTANWQKQKIFADNDWKLTSCPKGTDLGKFLQSSSVPLGFSIVRDNNTYLNFMTIKESSDWIFAIGMVQSTRSSQLCTYRILGNVDQGYQYYKDMDGVADAGFLYNADGSLKWSLIAGEGKDFSKEVYDYIVANKPATAFYVQGGTTGLPVSSSARGLILPSHDGLGVAIMIGNNGAFYVGQADSNDPKKTTNWWKVPNTTEFEQHSLEKWNYTHRFYVPSGGDTLKAVAEEVSKGHGSFTFWASAGALNIPFSDPAAKNAGWRGTVLHDNDPKGAEILWNSSKGQMGISNISGADTTPSWYNVRLLTQRSQLVSTDDLNSIMTSGDYTFGATKPKNAPDGVGAWSYMHVISSTDLEDRNTNMVLQMVFRDSHVVGNANEETSYLGYTRTWSGNPSTWSPWVPFGQTDSDWININSIDSSKWCGYDNWNNDNRSPIIGAVRRQNNLAILDLYFTNRVDMDLTNLDDHVIGKVPANCIPSREQRFLMQGSNHNYWLLTVRATGELIFSRYTQTGTTGAGAWFVGTATYAI